MGNSLETDWKECTKDFHSIMRKGERHYQIYVGMSDEEITYLIENKHNGITLFAFSKEEIKEYFEFIMQRR